MEKIPRSVASLVHFKLRVSKYFWGKGFRGHSGRRLRHGRSEFGVLVGSLKVEEKNLFVTVSDRGALAFG